MVRAPRADGTVHTTALCLARLEGTGIAEREVRVPTFRTERARRTGLDVVVHRDVVAPRQVVVVVLEETTRSTVVEAVYGNAYPRDVW